MSTQFLRIETAVLGEHDARHDLLAPVGLGDADHGRLLHRGVLAKYRLHLARVDVEPSGDDDLLDPVNRRDEAVRFPW